MASWCGLLIAFATGILLILSQASYDAKAQTTPCRVKKPEDGRTPVCLLALFPYPDKNPALQPSWDAGPDLVPAVELAVELINNSTEVLRDYVLGLAHDDGGCDVYAKATTSFVRSVIHSGTPEDNPPIVGIIGPGCSTSTLTVLPLSGRPQIALLTTHLAGSPLLEDRTLHPYGYSLLDSASKASEAILAIMRRNGWQRIAVLYEESRLFFRTSFQALERMRDMFPEGAEISFSAGVSESYIPLSEIHSQLLRIVVVMAGPSLTKEILCLGYRKYNFQFPAYQWGFTGRSVSDFDSGISFTYDNQKYNCSKDLMVNTILQGAFSLNYQLAPFNHSAQTISGLSYNKYLEYYRERIRIYNSNPDNLYVNISENVWATTAFDAVWAQALALNNSNVNLSEYHYGNVELSNRTRDELHKLNFSGVSGIVTFNNETGFTNRIFELFQIFNGSINASSIAYVKNGTLTKLDSASLEFIDDSFDEVPTTVHPGVATVMVLLTTVQLVMVVVLHILTIMYRKYRSVKASSPRINQLIFIGMYMLLAATYMFALYKAIPTDDETVGIMCQTIWPWFLSPGFTLTFGPIIARTWRLYRIFTHFTKPGGVLLSEPALVAFVGLLLLPDIIVAIVWTAIDPYKVEIKDEVTVEEEMGHTIELYKDCDSDYFVYWAGIVYGYKLTLILAMITLGQLTRNILNPDFTTKTLRVLVYILAIVFVLGVLLYYIFEFSYYDVHIDYVIFCIAMNIVCFLCISLVFFPPLLPLLKEKYGKVSKTIESKFTRLSSSSSI